MGVGRLRARAFTDIGMDYPWYFKMSWTCVKDLSVNIPIDFTPIAGVDVVKAAIYWYDARHELGQAIDNINLRLVNATTGATIRSSTLSTNEYEFLIARSGNFGGSDVIQNVPLKWVLDPVSVTADNAGCGTNGMMVYYALFFEGSNRDDADGPTSDLVPRE